MISNYIKIFSGDALIAKRITLGLRELDIEAIVKDESESARLAGFASSMLGTTEIYVHPDELEKATSLIDSLLKE